MNGHPHLARAVRARFEPRRGRPRVGLELELFPVDLMSGAPVGISDVRAALGPLVSAVTFEPGGQVELSLPCEPTLSALLRATSAARTRVEEACADKHIALVAAGTHPAGAGVVELEVASPRYRCMQRHFDTIGPAGRRMMRETAALQVCVDLLPGAVHPQWNAAVASAPVLALLFGTGPDPAARTRVWLAVDPDRSAHDGTLLGPEPVVAYTRFAAGATSIPPGPGREADIERHLSTLFPPVRPRGYLELRAADAQPDSGLAAAVVLSAALLVDRIAATAVLDVVSADPAALARRWQLAARGTNDPAAAELVGLGRELVAVARDALERNAWLDPPADALDDLIRPVTEPAREKEPCMQSSSTSTSTRTSPAIPSANSMRWSASSRRCLASCAEPGQPTA